ncbi:MAG: hypothetical protein HY900_19705 [Deltaproteobacteria bacterium]|nr:hypothetical protein [Deltaproteobacteria bacterium]
MTIDYTVQIWKEGEEYVAHAMAVDVVSSGRTPEQARDALDEAVYLFLVKGLGGQANSGSGADGGTFLLLVPFE